MTSDADELSVKSLKTVSDDWTLTVAELLTTSDELMKNGVDDTFRTPIDKS